MNAYNKCLITKSLARCFVSLNIFCKDIASGRRLTGKQPWDNKYFIDIVSEKFEKVHKPVYADQTTKQDTHLPPNKNVKKQCPPQRFQNTSTAEAEATPYTLAPTTQHTSTPHNENIQHLFYRHVAATFTPTDWNDFLKRQKHVTLYAALHKLSMKQ